MPRSPSLSCVPRLSTEESARAHVYMGHGVPREGVGHDAIK